MQQNRKRHEVVIDIETDENGGESETENKNGTNYSLRMCTVSTIALLILTATQLYATIK